MPNMDPKKCPMPSQEPNVRNKNFKEVALGYTEEAASKSPSATCLMKPGISISTGQPLRQGWFLHCRQRLASFTAISSV